MQRRVLSPSSGPDHAAARAPARVCFQPRRAHCSGLSRAPRSAANTAVRPMLSARGPHVALPCPGCSGLSQLTPWPSPGHDSRCSAHQLPVWPHVPRRAPGSPAWSMAHASSLGPCRSLSPSSASTPGSHSAALFDASRRLPPSVASSASHLRGFSPRSSFVKSSVFFQIHLHRNEQPTGAGIFVSCSARPAVAGTVRSW